MCSRASTGTPQRRRAASAAASRPPARAPNTSPSSSELLARRLAPWTPVHATSPAANSPGIDVRPVEIGLDAAHHVVRRRTDRHPIGREVEPGAAACIRDRRKPRARRVRVQMRERQDRPAPPVRSCFADHRRAPRRRAVRARRQDRSASMNRSPAGLTRRAPSPRSASRQQEPRLPRHASARSDETGRTRDRATRAPARHAMRRRRRSLSADSSSRGTPGPRRRSRAARTARARFPRPVRRDEPHADAPSRPRR